MSHRVPFLDLTGVNRRFEAGLARAFERVLASGQWILGAEVAAFEREFAAHCGAAHAVAVGNGLDALELVLRAWGIGAGDEVIVPGNTFVATWLAVTAVGATVVAVDPCAESYCLAPAQVERALTSRTRAIIPVHLYGRPAPMGELMALAHANGLRVLEDAAQAHGARLGNRRAGTLGDAAAFSFYPAKNLGALGDAGMVTTQDEVLDGKIRALRNYGGRVRYEHDTFGRNSRLDELQAAFLRHKLPELDADNDRRAHIAARYLVSLADLSSLRLPPADSAEVRSSWHLFVVQHAQRDRLATLLEQSAIATQVHYPRPPHLQPAYAAASVAYHLPVSERLSAEVLSLPIGPTMADEDVGMVIEAVRRAVRQLA